MNCPSSDCNHASHVHRAHMADVPRWRVDCDECLEICVLGDTSDQFIAQVLATRASGYPSTPTELGDAFRKTA